MPDESLVGQLHGLRQQLTVLQEQLEILRQQQAALAARLDQALQALPFGEEAKAVTGPQIIPTERIVARCAHDVRGVLQTLGQPLTLPEILDELVRRHLTWRENVVRHALDELLDHGEVVDTGHIRPHSYALQASA
jgi:hypothetical protein